MKFYNISITYKMLGLILPLVCLPIAVVGYFSYRSSLDSVTDLARGAQMLQARVAAAKINEIFQSCHSDLETISKLILNHIAVEHPFSDAVEDLHWQQQIVELFEDFISRSPYYFQIRLVGLDGDTIVGINEKGGQDTLSIADGKTVNWENMGKKGDLYYLSSIIQLNGDDNYYIYFAKSIFHRGRNLSAIVIIDIDFKKVMDVVAEIQFGEQGYAFLVDMLGRTIAHPLYKPYQYDFTKYEDPRMRELVVNMITGESGWMIYNLDGEKAAAYAPVDATRWSLGFEVPIEVFVAEAKKMRTNVVQVVVVALALSICAVVFISYQILRPIKTLAAATEYISTGDLSRTLSVKSSDELGMLTNSFNHMVLSLRKVQKELIASEKLVSIGRLSAGVAHEIRNPLNAMKGAIVVLQRRRADDALTMEYTSLILEEIKHLNDFVTEFLYFSRESKPRRIPTDVNMLVLNTLALYEEEFRKKGITVDNRFTDGLPLMKLDPQQIGRVLVNVIVNAMDAMPQGGQIKISTYIVDEDSPFYHQAKVMIVVEDNGHGISKENLKNVFDPFFSTKDEGTGLGMPICLGIVQAHNGRLLISSIEDQGTVVTIELPIIK